MKKDQRIFDHPYLYTHLQNYRDMLAMAYPEYPWIPVKEADTVQTDRKIDTVKGRGEVSLDELKRRLDFQYPNETLVSLPAKLSVSRLHPSILDEAAETLVRSEQADFDKVPLFMQDKVAANGAERGTATHLFMQFCDFEAVKRHGIEAEITRLCEKSFITEKIASLIDRYYLRAFFQSKLFGRITAANKVLREERFNVRMPAVNFTAQEEKKEAFQNEFILVQGVVDCLLFEEDGSMVLIDYKTDRTPKDRAEAEAMLRERYTDQLTYYRMALEILYGKPVKEALLYSFSLSDTVMIYQQ